MYLVQESLNYTVHVMYFVKRGPLTPPGGQINITDYWDEQETNKWKAHQGPTERRDTS